eukprot:943545-Prorocentrum_lima.AAC.1
MSPTFKQHCGCAAFPVNLGRKRGAIGSGSQHIGSVRCKAKASCFANIATTSFPLSTEKLNWHG